MKKKLIEVTEAKALILKESWMNSTKSLNTNESIGSFLAESIVSDINLPPFHSSAMDGFAVALQDSLEYSLVGEMAAGTSNNANSLNPLGACRIFTGAPVPHWADTVIMQEWANWDENKVIFQQLPPRGANIRKEGSHVKKGQELFNAGTLIHGAVAATISGIGIEDVLVFQKPRVSAIVTGNEVVLPGERAKSGQIFDSNIPLLTDFAKRVGVEISIHRAMDQEQVIKEKILECMKTSDVILATGGVSVGDYDYIPGILRQLDFEIIFHGVAQKPGKPLLFAKKNNVFFWGLPGNPISVAHGLWMYVYDFFRRAPLQQVFLPSLTDLERKPGLTQYYRAIIQNDGIEIIKNSDSHHIFSMSKANALVELEANKSSLQKGEMVKSWILPF